MNDRETRMMAALSELAERTRNGSSTLVHAVDVCVSKLAILGVECDRASFLQRCVAVGLGANLGPRLWQELEARRSSAAGPRA